MDSHPASDKSVLDLLKQEYQEVASEKEVYIPVRGYEKTGLAIKYKLPKSGRELDDIARKVQRQFDKSDRYNIGLAVAIDTMVHLCEGLYVRPAGFEEYIQLDPKETGIPVTLRDGDELSEIFSWNGEVDTARKAVRKLFGNKDFALLDHSEKLQRWLIDSKADLETEVWERSI